MKFLFFFMIFLYWFENNSITLKSKKSIYGYAYHDILGKIESFDEKKVIFVGGSNLGFGLNSKKIEDELNIKTFNLGVHQMIGLKKMIKDISNHLTENDFVIFSPEYSIFDLEQYGHAKQEIIFLNNFHFKELLSLESFSAYLIHIRDIFWRLFQKSNKSAYAFSWFNENGDVIGHHQLESKRLPNKKYQINVLLKDLYDLKVYIEKHLNGAEYYITPPVTMKNAYYQKELDQTDIYLQKVFNERYPISIEKLTFNKNCFFDTRYHLNEYCKEKRTDIILNLLSVSNIH